MIILSKIIRRIKFIFCFYLYEVARWLPPSSSKRFPWGRNLRALFAGGLIQTGKHVNIEHRARFIGNIKLGDYSGIGKRAHLEGDITIGNYVMMAPDVLILTINHDFSDINEPMCFQGIKPSEPVVIEDDVWIGQRVIILPGVTIGKGSIIGAGAVVAKNIPPYSIAVGNPVRVIKSRLTENDVKDGMKNEQN